MAYLGRGLDKISNIEVLDNITFDGSSSYSITKNSVAFTPNSAQSCLISIDGVVQATNFTVNSSTIDFGVAIPSTSTCNFFLHYGTGVMTVPSDGSVTTAKLGDNAVSSAKMFSGFANGITEADQFRLTAIKTDASDITANLERNDNNFSVIGSGMSESSGIFTFPQTGIYLITAQGRWLSNGSASLYMGIKMQMTTNNSSYANVSLAYESASTNAYANTYINSIVDITATSTHKVKFVRDAAGTQSQLQGDTTTNTTAFTFIRLGDT